MYTLAELQILSKKCVIVLLISYEYPLIPTSSPYVQVLCAHECSASGPAARRMDTPNMACPHWPFSTTTPRCSLSCLASWQEQHKTCWVHLTRPSFTSSPRCFLSSRCWLNFSRAYKTRQSECCFPLTVGFGQTDDLILYLEFLISMSSIKYLVLHVCGCFYKCSFLYAVWPFMHTKTDL